MVETAAPNLATAPSLSVDSEDKEPGHSGYSPSNTFRPPQDDGSHDLNTSLPSTQLNPSALTQRLLNSLDPSRVLSPRQTALRSSSVPNLSRQHGQGDAPSPANLEPEVIEKVQRTNSYVVGRSDAFSAADSATPFAGVSGAALGSGQGHSTPVNAPLRPALLSKKLLEPKKPVGKNPSFKECCTSFATFSFLPFLFRLTLYRHRRQHLQVLVRRTSPSSLRLAVLTVSPVLRFSFTRRLFSLSSPSHLKQLAQPPLHPRPRRLGARMESPAGHDRVRLLSPRHHSLRCHAWFVFPLTIFLFLIQSNLDTLEQVSRRKSSPSALVTLSAVFSTVRRLSPLFLPLFGHSLTLVHSQPPSVTPLSLSSVRLSCSPPFSASS
jgi:hypothetical protein